MLQELLLKKERYQVVVLLSSGLIADLEKLKGANEDENTGIAIVTRAMEEPVRQIVANAGGEGSIVVQSIKDGKGDYGYNARTEVFENLI